MLVESKTIFVGGLALTLTIMNTFFLQIPANIDLFTVLDKISTIGVLVYIAYTLNQKLEKLSENFQAEEKQIRKDFLIETKEQRESYRLQLEAMLSKLLKNGDNKGDN